MEGVPAHMIFEWVRVLGFPAIIFVVWYYDHKKINGLIKMYENQENLTKAFMRISEETQNIARESRDCVTLLTACISRMEQKISDNQFCPIVRKETGK